jgi:type II secretory pathway component PulF
MNDPDPSISQLSAKIDDVILGIKWMFSLFLLVISIPNSFASLSIHHFAEIFRDALPGKPLPLLTVAVISHSTFLNLLALTLPVVGILTIIYSKRVRNWAIGATVIAFFIGLQLCLTQMALFMPLTDLYTGMSDTTAK